MWHVVLLFCALSIPKDQCNPNVAHYQSPPMSHAFDSEDECENYARNVDDFDRQNYYVKGACERE